MTGPATPPPPLLPAGLVDRLPPAAETASRLTRAMVDAMRAHGYARVQPPLAEYLGTLDPDGGATDLMRVTDPASRRTLAIRGDMTRQVARIASTSMADAPRPLRLCYAGQVLRLTGPELSPARERLQVGAELIGAHTVAAAAEILSVAIDTLAAADVGRPTIDFTLPDVIDLLADGRDESDIARIKAELDAKDAGALTALGAEAFLPLIAAAGPFDAAIDRLTAFDTGAVLKSRIDGLRAIADVARDRATLTLDPTERHGFAFHSWFGFTLFAPGVSVGLGRGGSYVSRRADGKAEPAVGFSLYPDPLIAMADDIGDAAPVRRLFLPPGHDRAAAALCRGQGWTTIAGLGQGDEEAGAGCTHRLASDGSVVEISPVP